MAEMRMPEPRLPLLIFGNGLQARVLKIKHGIITDDGEKMTEIEFQPTRELLFHYDLKQEDFNVPDRVSFIRRYPKAFVHSLGDDPTNRTFFVLCDFLGGETNMTGLWASLLETNRAQQRTIDSLRNENAVLTIDIKKATSRKGEFQKEMVEDMKEVLKLRTTPTFAEMGGGDELQ